MTDFKVEFNRSLLKFLFSCKTACTLLLKKSTLNTMKDTVLKRSCHDLSSQQPSPDNTDTTALREDAARVVARAEVEACDESTSVVTGSGVEDYSCTQALPQTTTQTDGELAEETASVDDDHGETCDETKPLVQKETEQPSDSSETASLLTAAEPTSDELTSDFTLDPTFEHLSPSVPDMEGEEERGSQTYSSTVNTTTTTTADTSTTKVDATSSSNTALTVNETERVFCEKDVHWIEKASVGYTHLYKTLHRNMKNKTELSQQCCQIFKRSIDEHDASSDFNAIPDDVYYELFKHAIPKLKSMDSLSMTQLMFLCEKYKVTADLMGKHKEVKKNCVFASVSSQIPMFNTLISSVTDSTTSKKHPTTRVLNDLKTKPSFRKALTSIIQQPQTSSDVKNTLANLQDVMKLCVKNKEDEQNVQRLVDTVTGLVDTLDEDAENLAENADGSSSAETEPSSDTQPDVSSVFEAVESMLEHFPQNVGNKNPTSTECVNDMLSFIKQCAGNEK